VWKDAFSNCISQVYARWRTLRVERTFMAPECGSTSRKDAITPFSKSSAIVGPEFESRNLILLTRDRITRDLIRGQGENPRSLDNKSENDFR